MLRRAVPHRAVQRLMRAHMCVRTLTWVQRDAKTRELCNKGWPNYVEGILSPAEVAAVRIWVQTCVPIDMCICVYTWIQT